MPPGVGRAAHQDPAPAALGRIPPHHIGAFEGDDQPLEEGLLADELPFQHRQDGGKALGLRLFGRFVGHRGLGLWGDAEVLLDLLFDGIEIQLAAETAQLLHLSLDLAAEARLVPLDAPQGVAVRRGPGRSLPGRGSRVCGLFRGRLAEIVLRRLGAHGPAARPEYIPEQLVDIFCHLWSSFPHGSLSEL